MKSTAFAAALVARRRGRRRPANGPGGATNTRDCRQQPAVWLVDPGTNQVKLAPVQVARYTQEAVEIAGGLKPGDVVVRAGVHKLTAGQKVRPVAEGA